MTRGYFDSHLSLSQWVINANIASREAIISEDATKRHRLRALTEAIGLPTVQVHSFSTDDVLKQSADFQAFVQMAGDTLYAIRANPQRSGLPVLRNRRSSVRHLVEWIIPLIVGGEEYRVDFETHIDPDMSTIFIVADVGVVGEAISGGILQLNKGTATDRSPVWFKHDFRSWSFSEEIGPISWFVQQAVNHVRVEELTKRVVIERSFDASFAGPYLVGYFEVVHSPSTGPVFIDYNRLLAKGVERVRVFASDRPSTADDRVLRGQTGCAGKVRGRAMVVLEEEIASTSLTAGEILVCKHTSPNYLPLIATAAAVVTDVGGVLSHAAIVCRELNKPCLVATGTATRRISTGDEIEVDATNGVVFLT